MKGVTLATDIKEKTYRKLKPLSQELGMSRKRLEKLVEGEISEEDLTLKEFSVLKEHPVFTEFMQAFSKGSESETGEFLAVYKVRFYPEQIKFGLDLFYRYINNANKAIDCQSGVPYGDSSYHLFAVLKTDRLAYDDIIGLNKHATHWEVKISPDQQAVWLAVASEDAGGEENFKPIWRDFNVIAIESVTTDLISLNNPNTNSNGSQLKLL